ncbi:Hsp20/alpha crystallin family protein [Rhodoflexus caldus]|uniref:Hsp20/alpha crystallin family protein n=1 Tax=Rhodoflexus caldus TaxID=2891236 RepID=UPI00202AAE15|nr:Hsp20/alpha crystallin family protein [Rhodoflexus caldus]
MTLIQYPSRLGNSLFPVFNQLLSDFWNNDDLLSRTTQFVPAANIKENADEFIVELAVPGLKKEDFNIQVEDNVLRISATKQNESTDETTTVHRREFSFHSFERTFRLPKSADGDKIAATYTDGVLHLNIPKREEAKPKAPRTIQIA